LAVPLLCSLSARASSFEEIAKRFDAALAARKSGQPLQAANLFHSLRTERDGDWTASYSFLWEGLCRIAARDTAGALRLWDTLDRRGGARPEAQLARQYILETRFSRGESGGEWVDSLLPRDLTRTARIQALLGSIEQASRRGERVRANLAFGQFLALNPPPDSMRRAVAAMERGTAIQDPATLFSLARWHFGQDDMSACLRRLDAISRASTTPAMYELRGRALLRQGRSRDAEDAFRREGARDEGQLWLARALQAQGKDAAVRDVQDDYARLHPASAKGQEIFWTRGLEAEQKGRWDEAVAFYRRVSEARGARSDWARERIGYCWYKAGQWDKAAQLLGESARGEGGYAEAAAWFQGRALARAGKEAESRAVLTRLYREHPWTFHGHLARRALGVADPAFRDSLARLPEALPSLGGPGVSFGREDSARLFRARMADHAGFSWLSRQELSALDERTARSPAARQRLCLMLEEQGLSTAAQVRWRKLAADLPAPVFSHAPKGLLKRVFPMPWKAYAEASCAGSSLITPSFVHAVMRQESGFDPAARSPVGALGLLQLMPSTGRAMARRAGMAHFDASRLIDPQVSLRLGVAYLRDIARAWGGRPALVLANYNAGPLPCQDWKGAFDRLPLDEAVEEISFWETRDYVKRVMGNWWTYQALWGEP
jgi:soluble lytic murein transglycosylase-like protein